MKLRLYLLAVLYTAALFLMFTSCTKELPINEIEVGDVVTMNDLQADEDFEFKTTQTLNLKISSPDYLGLPASKIEVFNGNPNEEGALIKTGIFNSKQEFETLVVVSDKVSQIYVRRTTFDGNIETVTLDVQSEFVEYTFTAVKSANAFKSTTSGPGCTDCSETIDYPIFGRYTLPKDATVCIVSGGSFTGDLDVNGGTLYVCGNLTLTSIKGEGHVIINDDGVFQAITLSLNKKDLTITNYSDAFMVSSAPSLTGTLENYGTVSFSGININANGKFENYGTVNLSGDLNNNNDCINEGSLNVAANINHNNGDFVNSCRLIVAGNVNVNSDLENSSFMQINGALTINNGSFELSDQALLQTVDITVNSDIDAEGDSYCKIEVSGNSRINSSGSFSGNLSFWDENGIEDNWGDMGDDVIFDDTYIPVTYCNPGSNLEGGVVVTDTDGDGVSDDFDAYPENGTKAFDNIYPSANVWGTLAFEDLWPYMGDFDFNDMVIDYQINQVTNAADKVVEIGISIKVRAIGAAFKNGFGIQFPFAPSAIQNVSGDFSFTRGIINLDGNNTERNQDKAVVMFFDNAFDLLPHPGGSTGVNTTKDASYVDPVEAQFVITLAYPVAPEILGEPPYNAFIFSNGERGREVHLKNKLPTSLADLQKFGVGSDVSDYDNGLFYQTENGLPWAINIAEPFDYPIEKSAIIDAYNYFDEWVLSGGIEYTDWYTDKTGYRNTPLVY